MPRKKYRTFSWNTPGGLSQRNCCTFGLSPPLDNGLWRQSWDCRPDFQKSGARTIINPGVTLVSGSAPPRQKIWSRRWRHTRHYVNGVWEVSHPLTRRLMKSATMPATNQLHKHTVVNIIAHCMFTPCVAIKLANLHPVGPPGLEGSR